MPTLTHYIELNIAGHACEQEVELHYTYERVGRKREVTLEEVQVSYYHGKAPLTMNVLPLLTADCISDLEHWLLEEHEEAREPDPDLLREYA